MQFREVARAAKPSIRREVPVAWRLLLLRDLARNDAKVPATAALTARQLKVLKAVTKKPLPARPTVRDAMLAVAALGGQLKGNGDPGWLVLGRASTTSCCSTSAGAPATRPRSDGPLRRLRAELKMSAYARSAILRYLEEALAEGYAQLRVNGLAAGLRAWRFPLRFGYVTVSQVAAEGKAVGTIVLGGTTFHVSISLGAIPSN